MHIYIKKIFLATALLLSLVLVIGCETTENPATPDTAQTDVTQSVLYKSGTIAPGVVSWWPADGNADDIIDGNNGTPLNGATYVSGQVGQAFSLDGVNDYVEIPDATNLDIANEITIDAWIYVNALKPSAGGTARIVDKILAGTNNGYLLDIVESKLRLIAGGKTFISTGVPLKRWTHVAGTYDLSRIRLYIDGELVDTSDPTGGQQTPTNNLPLRIGQSNPFIPGVAFDGLIDEVEIYDRALSDSEINTIFKAGSKGNRPTKMVEICHKPGTPAEKTLVIPFHALPGHIGHGDVIGACE